MPGCDQKRYSLIYPNAAQVCADLSARACLGMSQPTSYVRVPQYTHCNFPFFPAPCFRVISVVYAAVSRNNANTQH
jgi:hypothetical protein